MKNKKKTVKKSHKLNFKLPKVWLVVAFVLVTGSFVTVSGISASQMKLIAPAQISAVDAQADLASLAQLNTEKTNSPETKEQPPDNKPPTVEQTQPSPTPEAKKQAPAVQKVTPAAQPTQPATTPVVTPPPPSATTVETASSLAYINSLRAGVGKPALTQNGTMNAWALAHANTLASQCTLFHQTLGNFLNQNIGPVVVKSIAENVGYASTTTAVLDALKNSPGHYANMTGDYSYVGIGVVVATGSCAGYVYTTQMFAK